MTIFRKGTEPLIKKARDASIEFFGMDGDGVQAPGAIVIREAVDGHHPFAVHYANTQVGGYSGGDYCDTLAEAQEAFVVKCNRYDPSGALHRSFSSGEG